MGRALPNTTTFLSTHSKQIKRQSSRPVITALALTLTPPIWGRDPDHTGTAGFNLARDSVADPEVSARMDDFTQTLVSIPGILRGANLTCESFTLEINNAANLRAAFILGIIAVLFVGWQLFNWQALIRCLPCTRHLSQRAWIKSWSCGLAADSTTKQILTGGLGATVAATLCYNQVLTVAAQIVAIAAFSHSLSWNFVEKLGEVVSQIIGLLPLALASYVLWVQQSQHVGWDWKSYPRGYIIMGLVAEGTAVFSWLLTKYFLWNVLTKDFLSPDHHLDASMPNFVWVDGASAVALQRARLIKRERMVPFLMRITPILTTSFLGSVVGAIFAGYNMIGVLEFWASSEEGQKEVALGIQPFWYKFATVMTLVSFLAFAITIVLIAVMLTFRALENPAPEDPHIESAAGGHGK